MHALSLDPGLRDLRRNRWGLIHFLFDVSDDQGKLRCSEDEFLSSYGHLKQPSLRKHLRHLAASGYLSFELVNREYDIQLNLKRWGLDNLIGFHCEGEGDDRDPPMPRLSDDDRARVDAYKKKMASYQEQYLH
jgi:hypothetical protein